MEVVAKASWHKGHPGGVSVSRRVNVTSVGSSEREKVPVMSLWGMILLVVLLCLFAASSIRKGKGMGGRMMRHPQAQASYGLYAYGRGRLWR